MSATTQPAPAQNADERLTVSYRAFGSDAEVKLSPSIVRRFLCKPTKKGVLPSDAEVMNYMMMCQARALNPFERDCFLVGYDGSDGAEFSIIVAIQTFLKRAEASPEFDGIESGVIVLNDKQEIIERVGDFYIPGEQVIGGWATVYKKNLSRPFQARLRSSVYSKNNKFWNDNPAGMIVKCAEADALRMAFPTKLGGLYIESEVRERDVTPTGTTTKPAFLKGSATRNLAEPIPQGRSTAEPETIPLTATPEPEPEQTQTPAETPANDDTKERDSLLMQIETAREADGVSAKKVREWAHSQKLVAGSGVMLKDYSLESLRAIVERWAELNA